MCILIWAKLAKDAKANWETGKAIHYPYGPGSREMAKLSLEMSVCEQLISVCKD